MKKKWNVLYYETKNNICFLEKYIDSQSMRNQAKILNMISLLEENGPILPRPYADLLTDGIHELRIKLTGNQVRILYFFCYENFIVLTHNFTKTTDKVPKKEIRKALKYKEDFLKRYDKKKLEVLLNENI